MFGMPSTYGENKIVKDHKIRNDLIIKQRVHKLKVKAFFDYAKEENQTW